MDALASLFVQKPLHIVLVALVSLVFVIRALR
jgi:hypothetical protein